MVKAIVAHRSPTDDDLGWDRRVDETRNNLRAVFLQAVERAAAQTHPGSSSPHMTETRKAFMTSLGLALTVALSK